MAEGTIVTVLGAGASVGCQYPLARDFFGRVSAFGKTLGSDCQKIRSAVEYVVKEAATLEAETIDDLAVQALRNRFGGDTNYRAALRRIVLGRIATDALFLSLENEIPHGAPLRAMKDYWTEVLGPLSDRAVDDQLASTKHRLVTFNYDRIPEIVFLRFFADPRISQDIYSPTLLNAGLSVRARSDDPIFEAERFCYLKLHGTIGVEPYGENEIPRQFGQRFGRYAPFQPSSTSFKANDDFYFKQALDSEGLPQWKRSPLIFFPPEKQRVESGGEEYNFKEYIRAIRTQAELVFKEARQIRVIGYSFAVPDKEWLISLLRSNPDAKKFIINPHAKQICEDLANFDSIENLKPLERSWGPLPAQSRSRQCEAFR